MLPVAPGGTGQPPSSPKLDSSDVQPACSAARTFARPWPRVLWKCAVSSHAVAERRARRGEVLGDLDGVGHAGRVAEGDLLRAGVREVVSERQHPIAVDAALVGAAEARRDDGLDAQPGAQRDRDDAVQRGDRRGDRAVDVALVVGLARREEDADLVEALALAQRALETALVGDEHAARDAVGHVDRGEHLLGVGELRDDVRAHEARDLDAAHAGAREPVDERDLVGGRDRLGLALEAVARADLADVDEGWEVASGRHVTC